MEPVLARELKQTRENAKQDILTAALRQLSRLRHPQVALASR